MCKLCLLYAPRLPLSDGLSYNTRHRARDSAGAAILVLSSSETALNSRPTIVPAAYQSFSQHSNGHWDFVLWLLPPQSFSPGTTLNSELKFYACHIPVLLSLRIMLCTGCTFCAHIYLNLFLPGPLWALNFLVFQTALGYRPAFFGPNVTLPF